MKRAAILFALFALAGLCAGCAAPVTPTPSASVTPPPAVTTTPLPTATLAASATPTTAASPTTTPTLPPSPTPAPTATPTLALPVSLGTALPELQPITAENFAQVTLVGDYRRLPEAAQRTVLSGDGQTFFTVTADGIDVYASTGPELIRHLDISVMRPLTGQVYIPESPGSRPLALLLQPSADGSRLMLARARGADVFSQQGEKLFSYDTPVEFPWETYGYAFSPDGRALAVELCSVGCYSRNATFTPNFTVYDVDTGQPVYQWNGGNGGDVHGSSPIFSPDGKTLATYIGGVVFLWDTATWQKITTFPVKGGWSPMRMVYFSPDSRWLALCDTERVMLWQLEGRKLTRTWPVSMAEAIFSADASKIGVLRYQTLTIYERETGEQLAEQDFSAAGIPATTLQNDGSLTFFAPAAEPGVLAPPWPADLDADALSFDLTSPAGVLRISPHFDNETCVWQPAGAAECMGVKTIPGTDGRRYRREYDQAAQVFTIRAEDGEELARIPAQQYYAVGEEIAFDPSRKFLFYQGGGVSAVTVMADLSRGWMNELARWPKFPASSAISPDGKYLAVELRADPNVQLLIYDLELHAMIYDRPFLFGASGMAFSADSSTLMHLLDQPGREKIQRLTLLRMDDRNRPTYVPIEAPWTALPSRFQFSPEGDLLYTVRNGDLRWMNLPDGAMAGSLDPFPDDNLAHAFALSPDGKMLAVFYQGELKIYGIP